MKWVVPFCCHSLSFKIKIPTIQKNNVLFSLPPTKGMWRSLVSSAHFFRPQKNPPTFAKDIFKGNNEYSTATVVVSGMKRRRRVRTNPCGEVGSEGARTVWSRVLGGLAKVMECYTRWAGNREGTEGGQHPGMEVSKNEETQVSLWKKT